MGQKDDKTNVMRLLEQKGVHYQGYAFPVTEGIAPSGVEVARILEKDPGTVFKTLVTVGKSGEHYVFMIPVEEELNLKLAAEAVGEKNIEMIRSKELLPLTGYIHGGCSPIGMKKFFRTTVDETAQLYDTILFSAGKVGHQVEIHPDDLALMIPFEYRTLTL